MVLGSLQGVLGGGRVLQGCGGVGWGGLGGGVYTNLERYSAIPTGVSVSDLNVDDVLQTDLSCSVFDQSMLIISPVTRCTATWPLELELKFFLSNNVRLMSTATEM